MTKRTSEILKRLDDKYGTDTICYLEHHTAGELLIATILSAQCTDARVNIVTKDLFVKFPDMSSFARADVKELEQDVQILYQTGYRHYRLEFLKEGKDETRKVIRRYRSYLKEVER